MENPAKVNLLTTAEVRALGWAAEARDADGHLVSTHAPFESDASVIEYLRDSAEHGETVTIFVKALREPQVDKRIVDWTLEKLQTAADENGRVAVTRAHEIAVATGNRVIRAMGGI